MGIPSGYTSAQVVQAVPTGINSALVLISSTTIGSAVSSVTVSSAFSATYDNYLVVIGGGVSSVDNFLNLTFGATATGYYRYTVGGKYDSATVFGSAAQNATSIAEVINCSSSGFGGVFELISPNLATRTTYFTKTSANSNARYFIINGGYVDNATQYTAFTLTTNTGTITGGTIKVYGYANS